MELKEQRIRILLVEEDEPSRLGLKDSLEAGGCSVSIADTAAIALEKIKAQFYDILLVDYKLPDMNGIELIKQAVTVSKESVPVVITDFGSLEIAVESMRIGAYDYVVKPINTEELLKAIESIIIDRENLRKGKERLKEVIEMIKNPNEDISVIALSGDADEPEAVSKVNLIKPVKNMFKFLKRFFWDAQ